MIRVRLLKKYRGKNMNRDWRAGTVLTVLQSLAGSLIADKIAEYYDGEYPPKNKMNFNLNKLK